MTISSVLGVHMNFCSLQFSIYYGHEKCLSCLSSVTSSILPGIIPVAVSKVNDTLSTPDLNENTILNEFYKARATSFIFLLGVGSYLCYKFYLQLKRNFITRKKRRDSSSSDEFEKFQNQNSQDSSFEWSACDKLIGDEDYSVDPENIELRYFGPDCTNDEASSIISDFNDDISYPSSLVSCSDTNYGIDSINSSKSSEKMGNLNSRFNEPVFYNVNTGIHFKEPPDQRTRRIAEQLQNVLSPSRSKKLTQTLNRLASRQASSPVPQRPNHLPVENLYQQRNERYDSYPIRSELSGISQSSNFNDSTAFPSEMESLCGSWSYDDQFSSHNGSLKGNFSPASLRKKTFRSCSSDLSPDFSGSPTGNKFYFRNNSLDSFAEGETDCSAHSNGIRISGGESLYSSLTREISVDSFMSDDISEINSLDAKPESIAVETFDCFQDIENEVLNIKHCLMELDSQLLSMQTLTQSHPSPGSYDSLDGGETRSDSSLSNSSAVAFVQRHKERLTSRGLLHSSHTSIASIGRQRRVSDSPNLTGSSTPGVSSGSESDRRMLLQRNASLPITPLSMMDVDTDSGSDFGQSLTSDSPKRMPTPEIRKKSLKSKTVASACDEEPESNTLNNNSCKNIDFFSNDNDKLSIRTSMISTESGFLEGMIDSTDSPYKDSDASLSEKSTTSNFKISNEMPFDVTSLRKIEVICDVDDYLRKNLQDFNHERIKKLNKMLKESTLNSNGSYCFKSKNNGLIRAIMFHALLSKSKNATNHVLPINLLQDNLTSYSERYPWLKKFYFYHPNQNSLNFQRNLEDCLNKIEDIGCKLNELSSDSEKVNFLFEEFNGDSLLEAKILDLARLLMMMSAIKLFEAHCTSNQTVVCDGPLFPLLLFSDEKTNKPRTYYSNHLKFLGNSIQPTELDLYLLSYSIGVTTKILKFSSFDQSLKSNDELKYYPDCNLGVSPEISIISTDDFFICCST